MESVTKYCENSFRRLNRDQIDLFQIHCPPMEILKDGQVFEVLDHLKKQGKIRDYGVSVETVEEGLFCLEQPNVCTLQVIFNLLRQKPLESLFPQAIENGVGILARVKFEKGVELSSKLFWIAENRGNMTRAALKWILEHDAISCVIPGFRNVAQVEDNLQALKVEGFTETEMNKLAQFYQDEVKKNIRGAY